MARLIEAQVELRKYATAKNAKVLQRFFKTGPGQYGEGDVFIGVRNPQTRLVSRKYEQLEFKFVKHLLHSAIHEDRLLGLLILVRQFSLAKTLDTKKQVVENYLSLKFGINNWDLVDVTAHQVVGEYCRLQQNPNLIYDLVDSDRHWDRRMAIVGTFAYIRKGELDLTFEIAEKFLIETEDLMHKATGWMLRETGKKDMSRLRNFIENHGSQMPRTMLRYAIEKFPERDRKKVLETTKSR